MTEYWVSQGNKWCDFCKIYIANNPSTIRNHELGQRHKDNVAKRLATMQKESAAREKEQKEAFRALEQIESKAQRCYQKDIASFQKNANAHPLEIQDDAPEKWEYGGISGYYYNESNGLYYDPKSGFYYSDAIGKWVTQEEAYAAVQVSSHSKEKGPVMKKQVCVSASGPVAQNKGSEKSQSGHAPGPVVSASLNPLGSSKAAPSSIAVNKRKRQDAKPRVISEEEAAALKAREAARKRVEERERPLLGLYKH